MNGAISGVIDAAAATIIAKLRRENQQPEEGHPGKLARFTALTKTFTMGIRIQWGSK